jgi:hypothetical protein
LEEYVLTQGQPAVRSSLKKGLPLNLDIPFSYLSEYPELGQPIRDFIFFQVVLEEQEALKGPIHSKSNCAV